MSRILPNIFPLQVQHLHPKDGVYPEKVNKGRPMDNTVSRRIGANPDPAQLKVCAQSPFFHTMLFIRDHS